MTEQLNHLVDETAAPLTQSAADAANALDRATAERLARIRYLFTIADQQTQLPESVRSTAVLTMHDAVELFLHLVAQHADPQLEKRQRDFAEYFQFIAKARPEWRLSGQQRMGRLNTARVSIKHHGIWPSPDVIAELRSDVERFLIDNTELVFGVPLESVSVVDLIRFPEARRHLRNAELALAQGDTGTATIAVVEGFYAAVKEYDKEAKTAHGRSPFGFAENFIWDRSIYRRDPLQPRMFELDDQGEFEDRIIQSIEALDGAVRMLSLGLNYRRFARFKLLTPPLHGLPRTDKPGGQYHLGEEDGWPPSEEDCRFCLAFAIDSALHLQEVVFAEPSWRMGRAVRTAAEPAEA